MAEMLQLSEWEFFKSMVNTLRNLVEKPHKRQKQMRNVTIEMKILRHIKKQMLQIKKYLTRNEE